MKRDKVTPPFNCRCLIDYTQTRQPLIKENLETHKKKSGDSTTLFPVRGGGGEGLSIYLNIVRMMHTRMDFTFWK